MWVNTGEEWISIDEAAIKIEPMGSRCNVIATHPALNRVVKFTGKEANGIVEYILRRRVSSTEDALDTIFKRVKDAQDIVSITATDTSRASQEFLKTGNSR